jgi:hypothetical protein
VKIVRRAYGGILDLPPSEVLAQTLGDKDSLVWAFAAKIIPEVESYTPVEVASSSKTFEDVAEEQVYEPSEIESSSAKASQNRYRDVSKLKDSINPVILPWRAPL